MQVYSWSVRTGWRGWPSIRYLPILAHPPSIPSSIDTSGIIASPVDHRSLFWLTLPLHIWRNQSKRRRRGTHLSAISWICICHSSRALRPPRKQKALKMSQLLATAHLEQNLDKNLPSAICVIVPGYKLLGMALLESHKFEVNIALKPALKSFT